VKSKIMIGFLIIAFLISLNPDFHLSILGDTQSLNHEFICVNEGQGLSAVDVLESTGQHHHFLRLLLEHDEEGYEILTNPILSDKTIWAPSDNAFEAIEEELNQLTSEEIKAILGYHISPPLSRPNGLYPIITFDYMKDNHPVTYRTRTGVLTTSDQRITSTYEEGVYKIENATLLDTGYCLEAGSVFMIDQVMTEVEPPSFITKLGYRTVRILFYEDIRFTIYSVGGSLIIGSIVAFVVSKKMKKE